MISRLDGLTNGEIHLVDVYGAESSQRYLLPLFLVPVSAGSPEFTEDYIEGKLDLSRLLVKNPSSTFLVRVTGDSMLGAGIHSGDILVVDHSLEAVDGNVVIAVVNGELTVKRLLRTNGDVVLAAENPKYEPIRLSGDAEFSIWGVVTSVIHFL